MNKLAKIQHKIIELVVGSSAVPVIAYRGITLNTFIFECELLGLFSFFTGGRHASSCMNKQVNKLLCQDKRISNVF